MKTPADVLREADPVRSETRSSQARAITRSAILNGPKEHFYEVHAVSRRRTLTLALAVAFGAVCISGGVFAWRHVSVDAVAAMRFEARIEGSDESIVDTHDILSAEAVTLHDKGPDGSTTSSFGVALTFTNEGAEKMERATEAHTGERLELLVDDEVVMSPVIRSAISSSAMLTGDYTREEATRIADGLQKGKMELRTKE